MSVGIGMMVGVICALEGGWLDKKLDRLRWLDLMGLGPLASLVGLDGW